MTVTAVEDRDGKSLTLISDKYKNEVFVVSNRFGMYEFRFERSIVPYELQGQYTSKASAERAFRSYEIRKPISTAVRVATNRERSKAQKDKNGTAVKPASS